MSNSGDGGWGNAIGIGILVAVLSTFRSVRVIVLVILSILLSMFVWDQWVTTSMLRDSEYEFFISTPVLDEMGGGRPATISPMFRINWKFVNKSDKLIETATLNGELFRCDSHDQQLDSCDYVRREGRLITLNLPAGRHTSRDDQFAFSRSSGTPGFYRAKIWLSEVYADSDREY